MAQLSPYAGRQIALLTQHGKERVIAPVLDPALGCAVTLVTGYDTDQLGTFSGEIRRPGSQLDAARRKARKGMELSGLTIGMASEGSFGPDPYTGVLPWNKELLVWIDDGRGIEIIGMAQGPARDGRVQSGDWQEVALFAERAGFPAHQMVVKSGNADAMPLAKGIASWEQLRHWFDSAVAQAGNGQAVVEMDLRAMANPSRMTQIGQAAADLLQRVQSTCAACGTPGFWITERQPGLPCAGCGLPTPTYRSEVWGCVCCGEQQVKPRTDRSKADPSTCAYCNR